MIRPIVKYPAPTLEEKSEPVSAFDGSLKTLAQDMLETMYAAPGVGLAAPQVGVNIRLIVVDKTAGEEGGHQLVLVNPEVVEAEGRQNEEEGCLSIPDITAVVERPQKVRIVGQTIEGETTEVEGEEILARILCHEIDHLDGILFINRVSALRRDLIRRKIRKLIKAGKW